MIPPELDACSTISPGAPDLKDWVRWGPENYLSTGVLEPCKNMQNLAHFEQFSPNRVGNPFGPQFVEAYALKVETHVSQDP